MDFEYRQDDACLIVNVDLDQNVLDEFSRQCRQLLSWCGRKATIDLTGIEYINSSCLGELMLTNDRFNEAGKSLRVVIPRRLKTIFDLLSMRDFIETEIV